jgi:hypothetical protein
MQTPWPSERASRMGLAEFLIAALMLVAGLIVMRRTLLDYTSPGAVRGVLVGFAALVTSGFAAYRIVRRREYPWILGLAAVGLLFYEPLLSPTHNMVDRLAMAVRDVVLVSAAVYFLVRTMRSADELERRVQLEALSWSYSVVLVALIAYALAEDVLPPLRGPWVASALLGSWVVAWVVASIRYQR